MNQSELKANIFNVTAVKRRKTRASKSRLVWILTVWLVWIDLFFYKPQRMAVQIHGKRELRFLEIKIAVMSSTLSEQLE